MEFVFGSGENFSDEALDDKVLISESCNYLNNVLTKLLNPRSNMFNANDILKSELFSDRMKSQESCFKTFMSRLSDFLCSVK